MPGSSAAAGTSPPRACKTARAAALQSHKQAIRKTIRVHPSRQRAENGAGRIDSVALVDFVALQPTHRQTVPGTQCELRAQTLQVPALAGEVEAVITREAH